MALGALPDYPWDLMAPYRARAEAHAGGIVDLSIGSPVDPTPDVVREALARATDAHAYPQTVGTPELRAAIVEWFARRRGVTGLDAASVLPTIGSKELVALLPFMLGLGEGDVVVHPRAAYPTYEMGALFAGRPGVRVRRPGGVAGRDPAGLAQLARATPTAACSTSTSSAPRAPGPASSARSS